MYADDATYQVDNKKRKDNQDKIVQNLLKINEFMNNNELKMNQKKTTTTECMLSQKKRQDAWVSTKTPSQDIPYRKQRDP